jgi:hypothetical protein
MNIPREATVQISRRAPIAAPCRTLVCAAHLAFAALATPAVAQEGKVSSTGVYQATLTCGGGVADTPGPNGESYTSVGVQVWDGAGAQLSRPSIVCGQSVDVGGTGAATIQWYIFVFDKAYKLLKQCQSEPNTRISGGRFACKASGNMSATLTLRPK